MQEVHQYWEDALAAEIAENAVQKASLRRDGWDGGGNLSVVPEVIDQVGMRAAIHAASKCNVFRM